MSDKVQRAIASLRVDLERQKVGLVRVFPDQLRIVLDALEEERGAVAEDPLELKVGSRVEVAEEVNYLSTVYAAGLQGEVTNIEEGGSYPYTVRFDKSLGNPHFVHHWKQNFRAGELRVIA